MTLLRFAFWLAVVTVSLSFVPMPAWLQSTLFTFLVILLLIVYFWRRGM